MSDTCTVHALPHVPLEEAFRGEVEQSEPSFIGIEGPGDAFDPGTGELSWVVLRLLAGGVDAFLLRLLIDAVGDD
jgi:hypothetical protein